MVLAESPRIYPVFTHHAKELQAAARYLGRRIDHYSREQSPEGLFDRMLERYGEVIRTLCQMQRAQEPYVYLNKEERELVVRINTWLRDHPEESVPAQ